MDERADKYLGKKLEGRYEIHELIGMGGMANVYKAYDVIDQRLVSVKILRDEYLSNTEFLRRFKNESKAIAVLSHPNIVQVYDVSFVGKVQSIVMEYIDGITLKDYIERQNQKILSWKDALHFTLQILQALTHAHEKGIVHRDIKPQNIMLMRDGTIKVTDFGIARFARSEVRTITDRAIGSVHYISPEQAMGENTDQKSDIYSVGVMLYEMLTGQVPFEAENAVSVAIKHIQTKVARPTRLNPDIPVGLEEITLRAMEKDATRRYQSAAAMIEDIEKFKLDPSIHFQYKYLGDPPAGAGEKKYHKAINKTREENALGKGRLRKKRVPYLPILAGVTFAFVLASIGFLVLMISINNPFAQVEEVQVPDLVGLRFDTALSQYSILGLDIVQTELVYNNDFAPGVIFAQEPRYGRSIRQGNAIRVRVSNGQQVVDLENFEGRTLEQARSWLEERGLDFEIRQDNHSTVPEGHVIYTNPSWGSQVRAGGEPVIIHVSVGPDVVWRSVPNVRGMTLDEARQMLELFNLRVGDISYAESADPAETVIIQDPMDGTMQAEGTPINVVISRGAQLRRVAIPVELPVHMNQDVEISAVQDGVVVQEEVLNPALVGTWRPFFAGTNQLAFIEIFINGVAYRQFQLDFEPEIPTFQEIEGLMGAGLLPPPTTPQHDLDSGGTALVYGHDANQPQDEHLDEWWPGL
ncbi:MAG: Stk1 family PASTA domain-containing Ser/Thr kinase [Oscillospiraceae bacterium]|nr:Stk1 family PASTA domain-containing Ser/Thr kinase [Oscillospiraceae bacterium]